MVSGAAGTGSGSVRVSVSPNNGAARTGTMSIAGQTITIEQQARPAPTCSYRLAPTSRAVGADPDAFAVNVTAPSACTWTASSDVAWITVVSGGSGARTGAPRVAARGNTRGPRPGTAPGGGPNLGMQ